jgi:hypothetical protein
MRILEFLKDIEIHLTGGYAIFVVICTSYTIVFGFVSFLHFMYESFIK